MNCWPWRLHFRMRNSNSLTRGKVKEIDTPKGKRRGRLAGIEEVRRRVLAWMHGYIHAGQLVSCWYVDRMPIGHWANVLTRSPVYSSVLFRLSSLYFLLCLCVFGFFYSFLRLRARLILSPPHTHENNRKWKIIQERKEEKENKRATFVLYCVMMDPRKRWRSLTEMTWFN